VGGINTPLYDTLSGVSNKDRPMCDDSEPNWLHTCLDTIRCCVDQWDLVGRREDNYGLMMMRVIRCAQERRGGFLGSTHNDVSRVLFLCFSLSAFCLFCETPSIRPHNCLIHGSDRSIWGNLGNVERERYPAHNWFMNNFAFICNSFCTEQN
jgi:hypothetical protein